MAKFCSKCGAQIDDNLMFCGNCGARVDAQPAPVAAPVTRPDLSGTPIAKKDSTKLFWLVAIVAQVLCVLLFLLPTVKLKVTVPGEYAGKIADLTGSSVSSNPFGDMFAASDVEFAKGNFTMLDVVDMFGTEVYHVFILLAVVVSIALMAIPLVKNTKLKPMNALYMLVAQSAFFFCNIITIFVIKGRPVAFVKRILKMITVTDVPSSVIKTICDTLKDTYKFGFSIWGWLYVLVSLGAIGVLVLIVIMNKDEILGKFFKKKQPELQTDVVA